jgi:hypothetical protein
LPGAERDQSADEETGVQSKVDVFVLVERILKSLDDSSWKGATIEPERLHVVEYRCPVFYGPVSWGGELHG